MIEGLAQSGFEELSIFYLARIRYFQKRLKEAESLLIQSLSSSTNHRASLYYLTWTYKDLNQMDQAYETVQLALAQYPEDVDLHVVKGFICRNTNRYRELVECIATLNELSPNSRDLYQLKMEYLIDQDQYDDAVLMIKKGLSHYPQDSTFFSLLAKCEYNTQQYEKSKLSTKQALQINPEDSLGRIIHDRHESEVTTGYDIFMFLGLCFMVAVVLIAVLRLLLN